MPRDCINWSQVDVARQFAAGKCAMMENGPWALPLAEEAGIDYGVVKLPVDERSIVVTGGENFGVIKGKNVDGALALLAYYYGLSGVCPADGTLYYTQRLSVLAKDNRGIVGKPLWGDDRRAVAPGGRGRHRE